MTMNVQTQGVQPQYDVIHPRPHNAGSQNHDYKNENAATVAARYVKMKPETVFAELY